jgi:hypothetical protein
VRTVLGFHSINELDGLIDQYCSYFSRLTFEEKEELYKVRPDLEVGPSPFFKEQMRELEKRNQRRTLFAIVGGVTCIMLLMVIYYVISIA